MTDQDRLYDENSIQAKENVLAGTVGAFLFALAGGVLWFVLYQVGFLAGISGLVGVICAIKGYAVFAKSESLKGVIIAVITAVIVMIIAWYFCLSMDVYTAYQDWYATGEVDYAPTFFESVRNAYLFLAEPEIFKSYLGDLAIGLGLCALGAYRSIANAVAALKASPKATPSALDE